MQKEMAVAEHDVRAHEDKLLEHMEHAETYAAELKAAEAALKAEQADVAKAQQALDAERGRARTRAGARDATRAERRSRRSPGSADAVRASGARPQGHRGRRGARRAVHPVSRPSADRRSSTRSAATTDCTSATAAPGFSTSSRRRRPAARPAPPDLRMIVAYIDGGARGNPGPAGYGVRIEAPDGTVLDELHGGSASPPTTSRNTTACSRRCNGPSITVRPRLRIRADSELLVKQMRGEYKVKNPGLQPLYVRARLLVSRWTRSSSSTCGGSSTRKQTGCPTSGWTPRRRRCGR